MYFIGFNGFGHITNVLEEFMYISVKFRLDKPNDNFMKKEMTNILYKEISAMVYSKI